MGGVGRGWLLTEWTGERVRVAGGRDCTLRSWWGGGVLNGRLGSFADGQDGIHERNGGVTSRYLARTKPRVPGTFLSWTEGKNRCDWHSRCGPRGC